MAAKQETASEKPRRHWLRRIIVLVVVLGLGVWFARPLWYGVAVEVERPTRGVIVATVVSAGRVLAPSLAKVASPLVGTVREVRVSAGATVKRGELLIALDDDEAQASLARARAALAAATARRADLETRLAPGARELARQAATSLARAEADHARDAGLAKAGALSESDLHASETALALARSKARGAAIEARAALPEGAQAASIAAALADAQAAVDQAEAHLATLVLTAPVDGVVLSRTVEAGDVVQPGVPLLVLAESGQDRLVIEPDEKNLGALALGQPAVASADAFPDRRFGCKVSWIAATIDPQRGTIEVHLALDAPQPFLKSDMTVSVEVEVARKGDALTLPRALVRDLASDAPWVMVVDGGHAARRPIALGLRGDDAVEIVSGLDASAVVIRPSPGLPSVGAKVRVPDAAPAVAGGD
ncbi:MAG: efflux RND transporter periplasmic adaptor subunit [Myxococcota bacterium]